MRNYPLLWPVSLSLGIHAALIALVFGQSGAGGGPVLHPLPAGPIVVEIVSSGTGQSRIAVPGEAPSPGTMKTMKRIKKKAPKRHRQQTALSAAKTPVPPIREETAKSMDPVEAPSVRTAESSGDAGTPEGVILREGSARPRMPLLAYAAAPPAPTLSGGSAPNGPGLGFVRAEAIDLPEPVYPAWCRRRGQEGKVILSVSVGRDGRPGAVSIVRSSGFSMLDRAAVEALQKARFSPASSAGILVPSTRKIAYSFRITDGVN